MSAAQIAQHSSQRWDGCDSCRRPTLGRRRRGEQAHTHVDVGTLTRTPERWTSLSFPGISSGIFAVSHDICARAYSRAMADFFAQYPVSPLRTIRLCLYEGPLVDAVEQALDN